MSNLKRNKDIAEAAILSMFTIDGSIEWAAGKHPVASFFIKGRRFTYSVDSSPKGEYTIEKTKKMVKSSLMRKAVQWGYIKSPDEFETTFMNNQ